MTERPPRPAHRMHGALCLVSTAALIVSALPAAGQEKMGFTFFGEMNFNWRDSAFVEFPVNVPFPPDFWEEGDDAVYLRTVDAGSHFEMSDVELGLDAQFTERFSGRVLVHVIDLYNKNPTSLDQDVFVREFWLR